jgi:predicted nuclease of restriction endonuclease-like (RecB) superfamily
MGKIIRNQLHQKLYENIKALLHEARKTVARNINTAMVMTYFEIGKMIVEHEQKGSKRAEYAKETLKSVSERLTSEFGRGFSVDNLQRMRSFYLMYKKYATVSRISTDQKPETLSRKSPTLFQLSWSHYVFLLRLPEAERKFYEIETVKQNWSLRELERQFNSSLYERLALSRDKKKVRELSEKGHIIDMPQDAVKEPYVLEFLGLKEESAYSESDLETAIINKIEHFMLELGKKG